MLDPNKNTEGVNSAASNDQLAETDKLAHETPPAAEASDTTPRPRSGWQWAWFVIKAVEIRLRFIGVLVAICLFFVYRDTIQNYWDKWTRRAAASGETASDEEFYCPMHPSVVRAGLDPNGAIPKCPICGMPLSKRKKGEVTVLPPGVLARVQLSPERIQLAGIETAEVTYRPLVKEITTVGYVAYDESRLSEIVTRVAGYIEKLYVNQTWITVKERDPLAAIYSPELYSTARELLSSMERKGGGDGGKGSREKLRLLGIGDGEIDEIVQSGKANHLLVIRSPQSGHITRKEVKQGTHVEAGQTLFEVADLSAVWIEADVYEKDIPFLRTGQAVEATVEASPNKPFAGKVSLVHPHLDAMTRTNKVRFEVENSEHKLRPGMFATVRIQTPLAEIEPFASLASGGREPPDDQPANAGRSPVDGGEGSQELREYYTCPMHPDVMMDKPGECPKCKLELERRDLTDDQRLIWWCPMHPKVTSGKPGAVCDDCSGMKLVPKLLLLANEGEVLAVPERAVIDTGTQKIVYIEREPGLFEGVLVELGPRAGEFYPVVKGLQGGDRVAAAGSFLIDAENRLNPAAAAAYFGASGGPQSAKSATAAPGARPLIDAETRLNPAGSAEVNKPSAEDLKNVAKLPPTDRELALAQRLCPVSGEPLGSMGVPHKMTVKGQPIFLCCKGCDSEAKNEPDKILKRVEELKAGK